MSERYSIQFDLDAEGEPPRVYIVDANGYDVLEVLETPTLEGGKQIYAGGGVYGWTGRWSWDPDDWEPGPFAQKVLALLNEEAKT